MKKFNYPSPYVGKWKNLTGLLRATPLALESPQERELQYSELMNSLPGDNRFSTVLNRTRGTEDAITNAYLMDHLSDKPVPYTFKHKDEMFKHLKDIALKENSKDVEINPPVNVEEQYQVNKILKDKALAFAQNPYEYTRDITDPNYKVVYNPEKKRYEAEKHERKGVIFTSDMGSPLSSPDGVSNAYGIMSHELSHLKNNLAKGQESKERHGHKELEKVPYNKAMMYREARQLANNDNHFNGEHMMDDVLQDIANKEAEQARIRNFNKIKSFLHNYDKEEFKESLIPPTPERLP